MAGSTSHFKAKIFLTSPKMRKIYFFNKKFYTRPSQNEYSLENDKIWLQILRRHKFLFIGVA